METAKSHQTLVRCALVLLLVGILTGALGVQAQTAAGCSVSYKVINQWQDGFVGDVTISNTGPALSGWTLAWTFGGNQRVTNAWNTALTQSGASVAARNVGWNASLPSGGSVNFGFQATYSGSNPVPTSFTLNGTACSVPGVSTATPLPPTSTPVPPTRTPAPPTATPVPPTRTPVQPSPTATPTPSVPADSQPPSTPANPRTSGLTCSSVTFTWDAATDNVGVVAYDIFHDGQFIKSVDGGTLSTSLTVVPNAVWDLYVQARDAAGNVSQGSTPVTIRPPPCADDTTPPSAPANLTATVLGTTVNLSWGASTDDVGVVAYDVYRTLNGTTTQAGSVTGRPPATSFTDSGLAASTTYQYYVVARDAKPNLSPRSNLVSVTTAAACGQPVCAATQIATDTDVPWGLLTLPDGSVLYSRRDADDIIRLVPGTGQKTTAGTVPNVSGTNGEGGLMGLEINPASFATDRWVYIMHTSPTDNRVVRMKLTAANTLDQASHQVLLSGIARNTYHDGGRLRFSPDGQYLFVSTGDGQVATSAQNTSSLNGKILRIRPDGSIPADNPFGNAVWSYGHRNPQGLAFDSQGRLWEQEFGNTVMDETNLIVKGANYGWPDCEGTTGSCSNPNFTAPKQTYPTSEGSCSGIAIVRDALYIACLRGERLYRLVISGSSLTSRTAYFQGTYGRLRTVEPSPDGGLWLSTSNGDKDSTANNSSTRIFRVTLGQ
jgi:glucose/arabinose dehydrogenase